MAALLDFPLPVLKKQSFTTCSPSRSLYTMLCVCRYQQIGARLSDSMRVVVEATKLF